ncbi:MAG: phosphate acetyltransferase [Syntrophales bacterium]
MKILAEKAKARFCRVVYPEATDSKIVEAARIAVTRGIARPILLGSAEKITSSGIDLTGMEVINPKTSTNVQKYAEAYAESECFPVSTMSKMLLEPLYYAAMMIRTGDADAMVAGLTHTTEEVILASEMLVGMVDGVSTPSSFFIMHVPDWDGGEDGLIVFADCAVVTNPSVQELAEIAITTASSVRGLLGWEPRVAMLSFSTKGSGTHPDVDKIVEAVSIARQRDPGLLIDGEMQADSAIVASVAAKKIKGGSKVGGRANILIFPDLDAGNIGYKLVQRLAKAAAYGPVLQGFARPVSDLSRGASVDDIVGVTTIVGARTT